MNDDFKFAYLDEYPDKRDELKKMHLLTYDGLRIPLEHIEDMSYFHFPFADANNNVYVIPICLSPFILNRPDDKSRQNILKQKFNTKYNVNEYYFLILKKYYFKSMYVFTEEQRFQDGKYLKIIGVITYSGFTWQERAIISPLLEQAFRFDNKYVPEFQYVCPNNIPYTDTNYDVEVKVKERHPEFEEYSLENISKVISYATTHSKMNINEIAQLTSINQDDVKKILSETAIIWNH
ncbi:MAG: hypothetical protein IJD40_04175 [Lachnospiraceae bacterium]|nr:hypothetical protein [Lachnospiraceae bacterium]